MFFSLIVDLGGSGEGRFGLITEECIVEFLVVDVKSSQVWTDMFAHLGAERGGGGVCGGTEVGDPCCEDILREFVGEVCKATFAGELFVGFDPVRGDGDKVSVSFQVECKEGIRRSSFVFGNQFRV